MFFNKNARSKRIESRIGVQTRIEGEISFCGGLQLDGSVQGKVYTPSEHAGTLFVGETGRVEGDVAVEHLVIRGAVEGRILGSETLDLGSTARVSGEVCYETIRVNEGAIIEGRLVHRAWVAGTTGVSLKLAGEV